MLQVDLQFKPKIVDMQGSLRRLVALHQMVVRNLFRAHHLDDALQMGTM